MKMTRTSAAEAQDNPLEHVIVANDDDQPRGRPRPRPVVDIPANDNVSARLPEPPSGGEASPPEVWVEQDPHVAKLVAELDLELESHLLPGRRKLLGYLRDRARADGVLPSAYGHHSYRAIGKAAGLKDIQLRRGSPLRSYLDPYLPRVRVAPVSTFHGTGEPTRRPITLADKVRQYVDDCILNNHPIPSDGKGRVSREGIAHEMGVSWNKTSRTPYIRIIHEALADGRLSLGERWRPADAMTVLQRRARLAELKAVADSFDVPGGKIPESKARIGAVDYEHLASLTGRIHPTLEHSKGYRDYVLAIARRRGTQLPGMTAHDNSVAAMRAHIVARVEEEQRARGTSAISNAVAGHRNAFARLVDEAGLEAEDDVSPAFGERFEELSAAVLAKIENPATAGNVRRFLNHVRRLYLAKVGAAELPGDLAKSLQHLIAINKITRSALAREVGCERHLVVYWETGICGVSSENLPIIRRMEAFFKLPAGTLVEKAGRTLGRVHRYKGGSEEWRQLPSDLRSLLPAEASEWPPQRLAEAAALVRPLLACGTEYGKLCAQARRADRQLPPFEAGPQLRAQLEAFKDYKMAPVTYPLQRTARGRWKSEASARMRMGSIDSFFRIMEAPVGESAISGLGIAPQYETIAWLAHAPLVLMAIAQRARRFADMQWKGEERGTFYTVGELSQLQLVISMINPVTGWLAQKPELAQTLVPLDARLPSQFKDLLRLLGMGEDSLLLTEADVRFARADWIGFCSRTHQSLRQAMYFLEDEIEVSRSPMENIDGLIRADEPLAEFLALALAAERRWADPRLHPFGYKLDVRDSTLARIHPITGFRPENLAGLTFTGDHRGEIRKVDGVWQLELHYKKFKNYRNCRLFGPKSARQNYRLDLVDQAGLYDLLDLYFFEVLPGLRDGNEGNAAFRTKSGRPMGAAEYRVSFTRYGARHIAYNPVQGTGFPGVVSINPYSIRHIRATDTLKNGLSINRVEEASFAIQTSEEMVRQHYGFMLPEAALLTSYQTFGRAVDRACGRN
ncbi:hypothetical protein E2493_02650 [Sphingomonas parva]|uniref:Uncharacterized protein n=1 Tax=Sphingomonas parva TaxID=2555898 RepID=A0A4Y8ZWB9_9SPHN|nr:hypothetical protein [Sphingomonas parva]TFI59757.1 hypothetical protein E2493_02650 [Sphingomonas parva]